MDSSILEQIKACSKDDASYAKLKKIFTDLHGHYNDIVGQLQLLECAVKQDYDSILITELDLELPGPRIVYVNDGFTKMTGYTKEEVIGETPRILQGPKTDRKVLDRLKQRLLDGRSFFGHTVNYRKDGREFIIQWDIHPLTDEQGQITHWVSYQRDISEKNESEKVLFDASIDFESMGEESKKTFVDLDEQGNILSSNKTFREMSGYDVEELKAIKIWDLIDESQQANAKNIFENISPRNIPENKHNWTFVSKEGRLVLLETTLRWFVNNEQDVFRLYTENLSIRNKIFDALQLEDSSLSSLLLKKDEFTLKFVRDNDEIYCKHVTDSFSELTGHDSNSVLGSLGLAPVHADDQEDVSKHLHKAFDGRCSTLKCRYTTADGKEINVVQHFNPASSIDADQVDVVKVTGILEMQHTD